MSRSLAALILTCLLAAACNDVRSMRRSRDLDGLVLLLSDPDPTVRVKAADALGFVGDSRSVRPLIKALGDEDPYVREHVARNLGCDYHSSLGCDTDAPVEPLMDLLDDSDAFVRVEAARSLGEHPLGVARPPLEKLARQDDRWEVRRAAAFALGRIGDSKSLPILEAMLLDENEQVVKMVRLSLRRLAASQPTDRDESARRALREGIDIRIVTGQQGEDAGAEPPEEGDGGSTTADGGGVTDTPTITD